MTRRLTPALLPTATALLALWCAGCHLADPGADGAALGEPCARESALRDGLICRDAQWSAASSSELDQDVVSPDLDAAEELVASPDQDMTPPPDAGRDLAPELGADQDMPDDDQGCKGPTEPEICARLGAECGPLRTLDVCDRVRDVYCGTCPRDATCELDNRCPSCESTTTDEALCALAGATCGSPTLTDECSVEREVLCGECAFTSCQEDFTCAPCVPETDEELCMREGRACGPLTAQDRCGVLRQLDTCGACLVEDEVCSEAGICACPTVSCLPEWSCGELSNGCGSVASCGVCGVHESCDVSRTCICDATQCDAALTCGGQLVCGVERACGACVTGTFCDVNTCAAQTQITVNTLLPGAGTSVSVRGDLMAVGAVNASTGIGEVYIFQRDILTRSWSQIAELGGNSLIQEFGASVALSEQGDYVAVGAPGHNNERGRVYIYSRPDPNNLSVWVEEQRFNAQVGSFGSSSARFGASVALHANWLVIGAPQAQSGNGRLYIAQRTQSGSWNGLNDITPSDNEGELGSAVAVYGELIVAGAPKWGGQERGAFYVCGRNVLSWECEFGAAAPPTYANGARFGHSVALSSTLALIGAPYQALDITASGTRRGVVHVYDLIVGDEYEIPSPAATGDALFGWALATGDDMFAASMVSLDFAHPQSQSSARFYRRTAPGAGWVEQPPEFTIPGNLRLGYSLALGEDSEQIFMGSPRGGTIHVTHGR